MSYITELKNLMVENGFSYESFLDGKSTITQEDDYIERILKYVPKENIRGLIENFNKYQTHDVDEFLNKASQDGMLSFKPYVTVNSCGTPTLVLKYNRFMHLFRGYYFQVSYTADGQGSYNDAGTRIDFVHNKIETYDRFGLSSLTQIMYYMNAIRAGWKLEVFRKLLKENPEMFDNFMHLTFGESRLHVQGAGLLTYKDILNICIAKNAKTSAEDTPVASYRIPAKENRDYAIVDVFDERTVTVTVPTLTSVKSTTFVLPDLESSTDIVSRIEKDARRFEYSREEYEDEVSSAYRRIFFNRDVFEHLVGFALNMSGFVTNYLVTYSVAGTNYALPSSGNPDVIKAEKINEIKVPEYKED